LCGDDGVGGVCSGAVPELFDGVVYIEASRLRRFLGDTDRGPPTGGAVLKDVERSENRGSPDLVGDLLLDCTLKSNLGSS
jgi:hypothetical protein